MFPRTYFTVRYADTGVIAVRETDYIEKSILFTGSYEPEVWQSIEAHIQPNDIVWDIGANIGATTVHAIHDSRVSEVHSFEPQPRVLPLLKLNVKLNNGDAKCTIHRFALSDSVGQTSLYTSDENNTGRSSLLHSDRGRASVEVSTATIDFVIESNLAPAPTIVKIDVEGWEIHVLRGAGKLFSETPPRAIVFEAQYDAITDLPSDPELLSLFMHYGYVVRHIQRQHDPIEPASENFLAVHVGTSSREM